MTKILTFFAAIVFSLVSSIVLAGQTWVNGYTRKDGTYVQGHWRTTPDRSRTNNYSYPGNINPYTGKTAPRSNSIQKTWPTNPNPYEKQKPWGSSGNNYNFPVQKPYEW